jgi:AAT family amino acid transporter
VSVARVDAVAREGGLKRTLSGGQMSMIAIGGAIGTGLFLGSGFAIGMAGPAVLLSYAVGGLISLLLMAALAEMTTANPTTGSFGAYAEAYLGPWAGFLVRYAYWSCVVLAVGTEVTAVAQYMTYWLPNVPGWWWICGFSACLIAVNAISVQAFGWVEYVFSAIKLTAIVGFILLGAVVVFRAAPGSGVGFGNYVAHGGFFPHGLAGAWTAVIIAIFSYLSLEAIAVAAGEAENPERAIAHAFRATLFRLVVFYLASLALMLAITPWTRAGAGGSPFVVAMQATGVPYAAGVINFVVLVAALSAMNSQLYVTSRMMFSLARAGDAPAVFGRVNGRGVPVAALAISSLGVAVGAVVYVLAPTTAFTVMIAISMFGAMFTWLMIFVTHLAFRARTPAEVLRFRAWGHPFGSLLGAGLMAAVLLTTAFTTAFRLTLAYGLPVLALFSLAYFIRRGGPRRIRLLPTDQR